MADNKISFRQKQPYTITPDGTVSDIVWESDSDGVELVPAPDGLSAFAVPDDDFVSVSDITVMVSAIGRGGVRLSEVKSLQVTAPEADTGATVLNLSAGEPVDK